MSVSWSDLPEGLKDLPSSSVEWVCKQMGTELVASAWDPPRLSTKLWCGDCSRFRVKVSTEMYSCPGCGDTEYGYVVGRYRAAVGRRSEHSRNHWMRKRLTRVVRDTAVDVVLSDFSKVLQVMRSKGLIRGRNASRYNYYIIRLCSRRGIGLLSGLKDLREGKTKNLFDNNLFGIVYKELGWDRTPDRFYTRWLRQHLTKCDHPCYNDELRCYDPPRRRLRP